jgi:hypothetical protein
MHKSKKQLILSIKRKNMKHLRRKGGLKALIFLIVAATGIAVIMLLWNALLPELFGVKVINYWQTAGLLILSRLLFGGLGQLHHNFRHFHETSDAYRCKEKLLMNLHDKIKEMSYRERCEFIREKMAGMDEEKEGDEKK